MEVLAPVKQLRNAHQILLPGYFREELQQMINGRGLSLEGPIGSNFFTDTNLIMIFPDYNHVGTSHYF